jgi:N-acetylglucosaminyldiphosphoundecaprenol N-acetyl-beta-D-mannosaminyltransferase
MLGIVGKNATGGEMSNRPNIAPAAYQAPVMANNSQENGPEFNYAKVTIGSIPIMALSREEWVRLMITDCRRNKDRRELPKFMTSANGQVISRCARDPTFQALIKQADAIDADGMSVVFASRLLTGSPLPERVATTDFFHDAAAAATQHGISFFLLGATREENKKAVSKIRDLYPELKIAGYHHGFFDADEENKILREIRVSRTDILWVGLGIPREHEFIMRNRYKLRGVAWAKSCGGLFNFLSGTNRRAPKWMQVAGLEWSHRVMLEPKRLLWRYFSTNGHAIYQMLRRSSSG